MVVALGSTSLLGAAFWWLAARQFSQHSVGVAGAAVSAMTLLSASRRRSAWAPC